MGPRIIWVSDHGGRAVLIAMACEGPLLDRRVELVDGDLPKTPYHCEGQAQARVLRVPF